MHGLLPSSAPRGSATDWPTIESSATPTISWYWSTATKSTSKSSERRSPRCSTGSGSDSLKKSSIVHIDEGFDFLGFRIQRRRKRGTDQNYVYTIPSHKAVASARARTKTLTSTIKHPDRRVLLIRVNS